ncbi:MAG: hypothetical protein GY754_09285 [bacterium]|nr:hypothetical protein [bacterium]
MKTITTRYILLSILLLLAAAACDLKKETIPTPKDLKIKLTYGTYMNDHAARKFEARERSWTVNGRQMKYSIDAHGKRYGDTIELSGEEVKKITRYIREKELLRSVTVEFNAKYLSKHEYSEVIRGRLELNGKASDVDIRSNGFGLIEKDEKGKRLRELEQIFYTITENR